MEERLGDDEEGEEQWNARMKDLYARQAAIPPPRGPPLWGEAVPEFINAGLQRREVRFLGGNNNSGEALPFRETQGTKKFSS